MAENQSQAEPQPDKAFALNSPQMTLLGDSALTQWSTDAFQMEQVLGSVYDTLRHPNTPTPMSIALYGGWGTGKTSSMRWLKSLLENWNREGEAPNKLTVQTVWFEPWKYNSREEVWRGIISEVILTCLSIERMKDDDGKGRKIISAVGAFGRALGLGFLDALKAVNIQAGVVDIAVGQAVDGMINQVCQAAHPQKAFLNEFETTLKQYIETWLGKNERIVVFIDDLDRCMPDIALEVLEALKLYLSINKIIFIVGIDREVVDQQICEHYKRLGVTREKALEYLDKMFQVDIHVEPSQKRMSSYFAKVIQQLDDLTDVKDGKGGYWTQMLGGQDSEYRQVLEQVLQDLAGNNPRQVKRLVNSALSTGVGAMNFADICSDDSQLRFAQGVQVFLLWRILEKVYGARGHWVRENGGCMFFKAFSDAMIASDKKGCVIKIAQPRKNTVIDPWVSVTASSPEQKFVDQETSEVFADLQPPFRAACLEVVRNEEMSTSQLVRLINNQNTQKLMRIPFSEAVAQHVGGMETVEAFALSMDSIPSVIRHAIASSLGKPVENLVEDDLARVESLDLMRHRIVDDDLKYLTDCTRLQYLNLTQTQISSAGLSSLSGLSRLQSLQLSNTPINDAGLSRLSGLTGLQYLWLVSTQISGVGLLHLSNLNRLQGLWLEGTKVDDAGLSNLPEISSLRELGLSNTPISSTGLSYLSGLVGLERLWLGQTHIDDTGLKHLENLLGLNRLHLSGTNVTPAGIQQLQKVFTNRNQNVEIHY